MIEKEKKELINILTIFIFAVLIIIIGPYIIDIIIYNIKENKEKRDYIINTNNLYIFEKCIEYHNKFYCDGGEKLMEELEKIENDYQDLIVEIEKLQRENEELRNFKFKKKKEND